MLYVFIKKHSLVSHFFDGLELDGGIQVVRYPHDRHGRLNSVMRSVEAYLLWWLPYSWSYRGDYLAQLRRIQPDDSVLYFSMENRKTLQILHKLVRARKQSVWFWDPIRSYRKTPLKRWVYKQWLKRSVLQACTFDPADARAFDLELVEQVFRHDPDDAPDRPKDIDLCFVGTDKGRMPELVRWKEMFEQRRLTTHFHVAADERKTYCAKDRALVADAWITYADNLAIARRSRCLLELLQHTQSGPTMRSIEALFFGCKLITNNAAIVACEFYHPSRIFVIGRDREADLDAFLQLPMEPPSAELLRKHEIRTWLDRFR